jgi:alkylation response protein AidB-like acyl-CoA dehydrogenase
MSFLESDEQRMLRESVRALARRFGHRHYLKMSRTAGATDELWLELSRLGYVGANIPEHYGGGGGGISELAIVCEELAAAGVPSFMLIVSSAISAELLSRHGSPVQKDEWLPPLARGEAKMAFAVTESDAGSNTHRIATTATRSKDGFRLRGSKVFASAVDQVDRVIVVARTDGDGGSGGISLFLVDPRASGFERQLIEIEMVAPEKQFLLFFDDVEVPASALLGEDGGGLQALFAGLNPERITAAALETGIGLYALEKGAAYARERNVWGVPIGAHQGVAHPLARCKIDLELARLMLQKAGWLHDHGYEAGEAANMAKYAAAEACLAALDQSIQTHGGNGLATEYGLATLWGAARLQRTAPVSREMIFNYVAQRSLGLPRSY